MKTLEKLLEKEAEKRAKVKAQKSFENPSSNVWIDVNKLTHHSNGKEDLFNLIRKIKEQLTDQIFQSEYPKVQEEFYNKVNNENN